MKPGAKDEVAGKIHEVKGAVKEKVGKLTNDPASSTSGSGGRARRSWCHRSGSPT